MRSSKNGKWPRLMFPTKKLKVLLLILSITLVAVFAGLTGCGSVQPLPTPASAPSATPTYTPESSYEYIVKNNDTCESVAKEFNVTVESIMEYNNLTPRTCQWPLTPNMPLFIPYSPGMLTPVPSPTPAPIARFPMNGYVMTFVKDGNLYFQDEENTPIPLAPVDEEAKQSYISDDNQKVAFHGADGNIYSINSDGSQKQVIVSKEWKNSLKAGASIFIEGFVPDSHQLFFRTDLCESQTWWGPPCSTSLFLTHTDTGNIKKLADVGLSTQYGISMKNIRISPNGKMIAIGNMERMDILDMDGNIICQNILTYKPSTSDVLFPSLFWFPDSSGLTIALPDSINRDRFLAYSLWRYTIKDQSAVQISLDPAPMHNDSTFDVSPDGNWIVYGNLYVVFLGNLVNEQVNIIIDHDADISRFSWGPDSRHFFFQASLWSITSIDNPSSVTFFGGTLRQWVDKTHFVHDYYAENKDPRIYMMEINGDNIKIYDLGVGKDVENSVFVKPK